jgi:predicted regulator of Ras-like GTPase activity (Roadblock/LC7/MglB family)
MSRILALEGTGTLGRLQPGVGGEPGGLATLGGDFDIADLCLLGVLSGRDGGIQAGTNGTASRFFLAEGALVHASSGELQGLAALKQILSWTRLDFEWMPAAPDRLEQNVRLDANWLLKIAHWRQGTEARVSEACKAEGILSGVRLQDLLSLLEKKRETGTISLSAAGCFGMLTLREGQIVQSDTDEQHGPAALAEILTWKALRVTYGRTAAPPAIFEGESAMADLEKLIGELAAAATDVLSTGIVRLSDGRSVLERSTDPAYSSLLSLYAAVVKSQVEAAQSLNDRAALGSTEDFLVSMERTYLLIRMLGPDHFLGMLLDKAANPGLGRYLMRQYEPLFLEILERAAA